MFDIHFNNRRF